MRSPISLLATGIHAKFQRFAAGAMVKSALIFVPGRVANTLQNRAISPF
jgi:hypothetical protein